jgi:hypothetical protein
MTGAMPPGQRRGAEDGDSATIDPICGRDPLTGPPRFRFAPDSWLKFSAERLEADKKLKHQWAYTHHSPGCLAAFLGLESNYDEHADRRTVPYG